MGGAISITDREHQLYQDETTYLGRESGVSGKE